MGCDAKTVKHHVSRRDAMLKVVDLLDAQIELALGHAPGLSAPLAAGAMGFRGRVPRLARAP